MRLQTGTLRVIITHECRLEAIPTVLLVHDDLQVRFQQPHL